MAAIDLKNVLRVLRTYLTERDLTVADLNAHNIDDLFSLGITKSQVEILLAQIENSVTENFVLRNSERTDNIIDSTEEIEKDEYSYIQRYGDGKLYFLDYQRDIFYKISLDGTELSSLSNSLTGEIEGLCFATNGDLYAIDDAANNLYKINLSDVSESNIIMNLGGGEWDSLAIDKDNTFYTILSNDNEPGKLYSINISEKTKTEIGPLITNNAKWYSLAFHPDGTLYAVNFNDKSLYTINKSTGEATKYGTLSNFGINEQTRQWEGITFDSEGKLYAVDYYHFGQGSKIYKFDISDPDNIASTSELVYTHTIQDAHEPPQAGQNYVFSLAFNPVSYKIVQRFKNTVNETLIKAPKIYSVLNSAVDTELAKIVVDTTELTDISSDIDTYSKAEISQKDADTLQAAKDYTDLNATADVDLSGYSTTTQVDAKDATTLSSAKGFTYSRSQIDSKDTAAKNTAIDHANTQDASHSTDDRAYTDAEVQKAKNYTYSQAEITQKDADTLTAAKNAATTAIAAIPGTDLSGYYTKAQSDTNDLAILDSAQDYTFSQADITSKDATTLSSANAHANTQDASHSADDRAYSNAEDDKHSTADRAFATSGDASTLASANKYSDDKNLTILSDKEWEVSVLQNQTPNVGTGSSGSGYTEDKVPDSPTLFTVFLSNQYQDPFVTFTLPDSIIKSTFESEILNKIFYIKNSEGDEGFFSILSHNRSLTQVASGYYAESYNIKRITSPLVFSATSYHYSSQQTNTSSPAGTLYRLGFNSGEIDAKAEATLAAAIADTDAKLAVINTKNTSQDGKITALETADTALGARIDAIPTIDLTPYSTTAEMNAKIAEEDQKVKDASRFLLTSWRNESGDPFTAGTERNIGSLPVAVKSGNPTWESSGQYVEMAKSPGGSTVTGIWWENDEIDFDRFTLTANINAGTNWQSGEGLVLFFGGSATPAGTYAFWNQALGKFIATFPGNNQSNDPTSAMFTRWAGGSNTRGRILASEGAVVGSDWTDGKDHTLRYEIWGKTIRVYFDGRLIGEMDTPAPTGSQGFTGGRFGFMVEAQSPNTTRRLKDIFITQATIATAEPDLALKPTIKETKKDVFFSQAYSDFVANDTGDARVNPSKVHDLGVAFDQPEPVLSNNGDYRNINIAILHADWNKCHKIDIDTTHNAGAMLMETTIFKDDLGGTKNQLASGDGRAAAKVTLYENQNELGNASTTTHRLEIKGIRANVYIGKVRLVNLEIS